MTTLELGTDPGALTVYLTTGSDFDCILRYRVGGTVSDWPASTEISLVFDDSAASEWDAAVSGSDATFSVDKATADTMPDGTVVRLRYVNGTTDRIWYVGKVSRRG